MLFLITFIVLEVLRNHDDLLPAGHKPTDQEISVRIRLSGLPDLSVHVNDQDVCSSDKFSSLTIDHLALKCDYVSHNRY